MITGFIAFAIWSLAAVLMWLVLDEAWDCRLTRSLDPEHEDFNKGHAVTFFAVGLLAFFVIWWLVAVWYIVECRKKTAQTEPDDGPDVVNHLPVYNNAYASFGGWRGAED